MKLMLFILLLFSCRAGIKAQNNSPIFNGGNGDGWASGSFIQPFNGIYTGGNGDGWASSNFMQTFDNIFSGGNRDGWATNNFIQSFIIIYNGGNGDGWASASYLPQAALPVTMLSLDAQKQNNAKALIEWETSNEPAIAYFDVEKSPDAVHYACAGRVQAPGKANKGMTYSFTDTHPLTGINYYRLKQVAIDNHATLSPSRLLVFDEAGGGSIKYYPNPTNGILNIAFSSQMQHEAAVLNVINATGVVMDQMKIAAGARNIIQLNLSRYAKGTYLIQVKTTSVNNVQKVVLQ